MGPMTPPATFKELSVDSHAAAGQDPTELARFWAAAAGLELVRSNNSGDPGDLVGTEEGMGVAVCNVPEPKTVKHRVHVDVSASSVQELVELGATVQRQPDAENRWTVMADPEGGEFCAFVRAPEKLTPYRVFEVVVDAVDAERAARWWADVFGVEPQNNGKPWWWIEGAAGFPGDVPWWGMVFNPVPEPKTVKNRWHWDLYGDVDAFLARGATLLWELPRWTTLADPEGNEFCVFAPRGGNPVQAR